MFDQWIDTCLFFLAAFGEALTGKLVTRLVHALDRSHHKSKCYLPTSFNQEYHLQVTNAWMQY
jgi:hypothetical protein